MQPIRLLLIEDNPADAELIQEALGEASRSFRLERCARLEDGLSRLARGGIQVLLLDLSLPDAFGLEGLRRVRAEWPELPVVVLTGQADASLGARALQEGAQDYLIKGECDGPPIARALRYAIERQEFGRKARQLEGERAAREAAERAHQSALLLCDASNVLAASLDHRASLRAMAQVVVPRFADACVVDVLPLEGSGKEERILHPEPGGNTPHRLLPSPEHAIRTGRPDLHPDAMVVPMIAHGRTLGAITFLASRSEGRFGPDHLMVAEEIGRRAAVALENARLYRLANEAVAARDEFISIASHEFRTPLAALPLYLQRLQREAVGQADLGAPFGRSLEASVRQVKRLARLVDSLLDVTRIESGRWVMQPEGCDLSQLAREAVGKAQAMINGPAARVALEISGPVKGSWDMLAVERVLENLLANALKYGEGGLVEVSVRTEGAFAVLSVADQGIGISRSDVERIFLPFARAVSARHYGGLGLGLYITRKLVEAHGGAIGVTSRPGEGTVFTVRLPLRVSSAPPAEEHALHH